MTDTARILRYGFRSTLSPAVKDLNGQIITPTDEEPIGWVAGKGFSRVSQATEWGYPVPGFYKQGSVFAKLHWESSRLPVLSGTLPSRQTSAWKENTHRRHVSQTALVRARLSAKNARTLARTAPTPIPSVNEDKSPFKLSLPVDNGSGTNTRASSPAKSPRKSNSQRPRPATTGRYFDTSNGLRSSRDQPPVRTRPKTAGQCISPGLSIQKLTLHEKDYVTFMKRSSEHDVTFMKRPSEHDVTFMTRSSENDVTFMKRSSEHDFTFVKKPSEQAITYSKKNSERQIDSLLKDNDFSSTDAIDNGITNVYINQHREQNG